MFWRPGAAARYQRAVQQMLKQEPLGRPPGEARGRIVKGNDYSVICAR